MKSVGKKAKPVKYDIVIVGGGPAGLAFAAALKNSGLELCLIEKQAGAVLANPQPDGRDIALTHSSIRILKELGMFARLPAAEISPIRQARVLDGTSPYALTFDSKDEGREALGYLVSNHLIRKAAYAVVRGQKNLDLRTGVEVKGLVTGTAKSTVTLSDGSVIEAPLVVAADSRFSACRKLMGVSAAMQDFGRTVVVCRVTHEKPHDNIAHECFFYGRTLALLPLKGRKSSAVITLASDEVKELMNMPEAKFAADIARRFGNKLGAMKLEGKRHSYPLVAIYAGRFAGERFALLGDAAVGMHPVTAHGYNFGLYGVHVLAKEILKAKELGLDIGSQILLDRYNRAHRKATMPLYLGTNTLVRLFTNDRPAAKLVRKAVLRAGNLALPFKRIVTKQLTQTSLAG